MSPTLELQGAIVPRLKQDTALIALVAGRIYEVPKLDAALPFVAMGPADETQTDAECIDTVEVNLQIDAYATNGFVDVGKIADAVRASLHRADLTLTTNALVLIEHRQTRRQMDPDGKTAHAVIEFVATIETR